MTSENTNILNRIEEAPYAEEIEIFRDWVENLEEGDHLMINGDRYEITFVCVKNAASVSVTSPEIKQGEHTPDTLRLSPSIDGDILILVSHNYPVQNTRIVIDEIEQVEATAELYKEAKAR